MPSNNQKTPLVDSLNRFTSSKINDAGELTGKALPASIMAVNDNKSIVTVNFEVKTDFSIPMIQCPVAMPEYIRLPIKKGDKGFVMAVDTYMGGMSGIGGGVATLDQQPNLSTLVWFPCGNMGLSASEAPNKLVQYGPDGVVLKSSMGEIKFTMDKTAGLQIEWNGTPLLTMSQDGIALQFQGKGIVINSSGTEIDGRQFLPHVHTGVQTGPSDTGPVF